MERMESSIKVKQRFLTPVLAALVLGGAFLFPASQVSPAANTPADLPEIIAGSFRITVDGSTCYEGEASGFVQRYNEDEGITLHLSGADANYGEGELAFDSTDANAWPVYVQCLGFVGYESVVEQDRWSVSRESGICQRVSKLEGLRFETIEGEGSVFHPQILNRVEVSFQFVGQATCLIPDTQDEMQFLAGSTSCINLWTIRTVQGPTFPHKTGSIQFYVHGFDLAGRPLLGAKLSFLTAQTEVFSSVQAIAAVATDSGSHTFETTAAFANVGRHDVTGSGVFCWSFGEVSAFDRFSFSATAGYNILENPSAPCSLSTSSVADSAAVDIKYTLSQGTSAAVEFQMGADPDQTVSCYYNGSYYGNYLRKERLLYQSATTPVSILGV
jgi:hypothetical protein